MSKLSRHRVSGGQAGTDPRSGLVAQRTSGDGVWVAPNQRHQTFFTGKAESAGHRARAREDQVGAVLHIAASANHGTHSLHQLSQLRRREPARRPQDDRLMNGNESVGKSHARPIDATAHEIIRADGHRGRVRFRSTRYLADQQVSPCKRREDDGGPTLARLKISERKRHDDHVAAYKFRHASSSSGVSQSTAQADSASGSRACTSSPPSLPAPRARRCRRKASTSRCTLSGACSSSSIRDLVMGDMLQKRIVRPMALRQASAERSGS